MTKQQREEIEYAISRFLATMMANDLNTRLEGLRPEDRVHVFNLVRVCYCPDCGGDTLPCHCQNDE